MYCHEQYHMFEWILYDKMCYFFSFTIFTSYEVHHALITHISLPIIIIVNYQSWHHNPMRILASFRCFCQPERYRAAVLNLTSAAALWFTRHSIQTSRVGAYCPCSSHPCRQDPTEVSFLIHTGIIFRPTQHSDFNNWLRSLYEIVAVSPSPPYLNISHRHEVSQRIFRSKILIFRLC